MVIVLMGVCGCGKTTIGELLSRQLGWPYFDGDDFHPRSNVEKMARGIPLTDEDRLPWLRILSDQIGRWIREGRDAILGCSALKESYRRILVQGRPEVHIAYLKGDPDLIRQRLRGRIHRYMPASLLESQFEALEEPENAVVVDISPPPEIVARRIREQLGI